MPNKPVILVHPEDQSLLQESLCEWINQYWENFNVTGDVLDGQEMVTQVRRLALDKVIFDLARNWPGWFNKYPDHLPGASPDPGDDTYINDEGANRL